MPVASELSRVSSLKLSCWAELPNQSALQFSQLLHTHHRKIVWCLIRLCLFSRLFRVSRCTPTHKNDPFMTPLNTDSMYCLSFVWHSHWGGELQSHGAREKTKRRQRWEALCSMCTKIQFNTVCTNRYMSSRSNWSGKMCLWGLADIKENGKGNCVKEKRRECAVNSGVTCAFIKAAGEKYWTHSGRQNNEACQILDIVT